MKTVIVSAIVAIVASLVTTTIVSNMNSEGAAVSEAAQPEINIDDIISRLDLNEMSVSEQPAASAWIRGGSGAAQAEQKILTNAANSACFLTHVEINGIQSAADKNSCSITVDDFTGFWQVNAVTGEGTESELLCNARCVVWE